MKKHSSADIAAKLAQAEQLAAQGLSQNVICSQLGISVMTLHRWRARATSSSADVRLEHRLASENSRLRDVAANLLLEIRALEETRDEPAQPAHRGTEPTGSKTDQPTMLRERILPTEA